MESGLRCAHAERVLRKRRERSAEDTVLSRESAGDTTFALLECAELVVSPILQSMSMLAWQVCETSSTLVVYVGHGLVVSLNGFSLLLTWVVNSRVIFRETGDGDQHLLLRLHLN